jgi:hypothetical protein
MLFVYLMTSLTELDGKYPPKNREKRCQPTGEIRQEPLRASPPIGRQESSQYSCGTYFGHFRCLHGSNLHIEPKCNQLGTGREVVGQAKEPVGFTARRLQRIREARCCVVKASESIHSFVSGAAVQRSVP